jgi:1,4-alpha-glucan branching enzyme
LARPNPARAFDRVIFSESHDEVANGKARLPEEIAPNQAANPYARKRAGLAAALVMTAPGVPMLFQGQEFLEDGWFDDRAPLDWSKTRTHRGNLILYRDLIRLRRNVGRRTRGLQGEHVQVYHVNNCDKLIAFHRWQVGGPGDDVVVVMNFANRTYDAYTLGFPRPGLWRARLNSDRRIYGDDFTDQACPDVVAARTSSGSLVDGMPCWGNVTIGPYAALILSQEPA